LLSTATADPKRVRRRICAKMHQKKNRQPPCSEFCTAAIEARKQSQHSKESGFPQVVHCYHLPSRPEHDGKMGVLAHPVPRLELRLSFPVLKAQRGGRPRSSWAIRQYVLIWMEVQLNGLLGFFWIAAPLPFLNRVYCRFCQHRMPANDSGQCAVAVRCNGDQHLDCAVDTHGTCQFRILRYDSAENFPCARRFSLRKNMRRPQETEESQKKQEHGQSPSLHWRSLRQAHSSENLRR
jgi:hypothetical protein